MEVKKYRLDDKDIMSASEAAKRWGKGESFIRYKYFTEPEKFMPGTFRKFGSTFVITKQGMEFLTGQKELAEQEE